MSRPLDPAFHLDRPALGIEAEYAIEAAHVEEVVLAELLASHRVAAAGNRHRLALRSSTRDHRGAHIVHPSLA